ncbi:AbrB/MazE/SpoVT family DNA-binding domain-containing protein [Dokdonella sp.]|uniref:AbrB/MazE/SpoVT family DNA-binding domain-containing protein n=1 Tax=Dokdonella sp. TaxID=2291710 RepID=UPI0025BFD8A2|nr:AbrB/MazE/SpoVT family DNA-binding domain-containing protein [Dokdonella sp.]MBX3688567.1 AbrB/MazE/SpoVT family DNA-binding domain-containing protein [Dokdonella sp.]
MGTLTVTTKGQVTLRKDVLNHMGVRPGGRIVVDMLPDGRVEVRAERAQGRVSDVFNVLKPARGKALSLAQIQRIAASGWAGKR